MLELIKMLVDIKDITHDAVRDADRASQYKTVYNIHKDNYLQYIDSITRSFEICYSRKGSIE